HQRPSNRVAGSNGSNSGCCAASSPLQAVAVQGFVPSRLAVCLPVCGGFAHGAVAQGRSYSGGRAARARLGLDAERRRSRLTRRAGPPRGPGTPAPGMEKCAPRPPLVPLVCALGQNTPGLRFWGGCNFRRIDLCQLVATTLGANLIIKGGPARVE